MSEGAQDADEVEHGTPDDYVLWLEENISDFECSRCGVVHNSDPVETRFGPVDSGCALSWQAEGKLQQRSLSDFGAATDGGEARAE